MKLVESNKPHDLRLTSVVNFASLSYLPADMLMSAVYSDQSLNLIFRIEKYDQINPMPAAMRDQKATPNASTLRFFHNTKE